MSALERLLLMSLAVRKEMFFGIKDCLNLGVKCWDLLLGVKAVGRYLPCLFMCGNLRKSKSVTTLVRTTLLFKFGKQFLLIGVYL